MIDSALNEPPPCPCGGPGLGLRRGSGNGYTPLQPRPYVYDNAAFDSLDYASSRPGTLASGWCSR